MISFFVCLVPLHSTECTECRVKAKSQSTESKDLRCSPLITVRPLDPRSQSDYQVMHISEIWLIRHKPDVSWELHMHISASMRLFLFKESEAQNSVSVMCDFQTRLAFIHALQRQVSSLQLSAALQQAKTQHAKL